MNFIWQGDGWYSAKDGLIKVVVSGSRVPSEAAIEDGFEFPPIYLDRKADAEVLTKLAGENPGAFREFLNPLEMMAYILVVAPRIGEIAELIASNPYVFSEITESDELDTLSIAKKVLEFVVKQFNATGGRGMRIRTLYGTEGEKVATDNG